MQARAQARVPIALGCVLALVAGCARPPLPAPRTSLPVLAEGDTDPALGYELPPVQRAAEVLPPALLEGPHHRVADAVPTDGFMRHFSVACDFGDLEVEGDALLGTRIEEIGALARLADAAANPAFEAARARAERDPFAAAFDLVALPVARSTGLPREAEASLRRTAALAQHERSQEDEAALRAFFGFEAGKRALAARLGVDPDSSNRALQEALNRFAWVAQLGDLPAERAPAGSGAEAGANAAGADAGSPEDRRRLARLELATMGIPAPLREQFVAHPWYTPRDQSRIVAELAALDLVAGRAAFVEAALNARSEEDARLYLRTAQLLRAYHEAVAPLERLAVFERTVLALTRDARLVAALPLDHAVWTRPAHEFANRLVRTHPSDGREIRRRELILSGALSPKARALIEARGIRVVEHALETLRPEPAPPAAAGSAG